MNEELSRRLRQSRTSRELTQTSLARAAKTTHASVSRIEHATQDPAASTLSLLAQALDVSTDYLLGLTDNPTPAAQLVPVMSDSQQETDVVALRDVRAAAGWEAKVEAESVIGHVAFPRRWMRRHGLRPERCSVIEVVGDSMEPLLEDSCWILVDHGRNALLSGRVFAVWTGDGLLVKRAERSGVSWRLASENAAYDPVPLPRASRVVGEVKWAGRSL